MELRHLRLVRALAAKGTLTSAGKQLHLSQSALSHQLRELETELETPLFHRVKKRMVLTPAGSRVLTTANSVLGHIERLDEDIVQMNSGEQGILRIAACSNTCFHWLPKVLKLFIDAHPAVEVRIDSSASHEPIEHLENGVIDLAIMNMKTPSKAAVYHKLFNDEMVAIVHKNHPWAKKDHVTPRAFARETLINYDRPIEEVVFYQRILLPANIMPESLIKLPMTDAIIEMVRAGMGVAVLNLWSVRPYLDSSDLKAIRVTKNGFIRTWYAVVLRQEQPLTYVGQFIDFLCSQETE